MGFASQKLIFFMNKEELLQELSNKITTGEISKTEVINKLDLVSIVKAVDSETEKSTSHFSVTKMLYTLGAAVVIIGIIIFVSQVWDNIGSIGHIAVTLGLGLIFTAIGSVLLKQKLDENIGLVFHCIGGLLIPGGAMVTLNELGVDFVSLWPTISVFGVLFLFYLLLTSIHKSYVLTFFAIGNGTAFIYLLVEEIIKGSFYMHGDVYAYLTMVIGVTYIFLAQSFRGGWNDKLIGALHFLGSIAFLGAAFSRVFDSTIWQLGFFVIVISGLFLSVFMRSRIILVTSTGFLIAHIAYITGKYFADSLGWPISLVILGFVFMGLGYISVNINRKYIK